MTIQVGTNTLFIYEGQDLTKAKLCNRNLECHGLRSCQGGQGFCDNGICMCLALSGMNTKRIDVNHGGICDTYLECGNVTCFDFRRACCIKDKCVCRKQGQVVPDCPN